jgi:hypothetical protein
VKLKDAAELADVDLLQLVGHGAFELSAQQVEVLSQWLKAGGMLLMDASGGKELFIQSADALFEALRQGTGGTVQPVGVDHAVVAGGMAGGKPLEAATYRSAATPKMPEGAPNLKALRIGGRDAVLYSPMDLSATVNGHFIYGMNAYQPQYARDLMGNVLLLRFGQLRGTP